jgi:hypothetical protein
MLADCAEALNDSSATAPSLKSTTSKLYSLIRDEVSWQSAGLADGVFKECSNRSGIGLLPKDGKAHDPPRVVINGTPEPPAEGPTLREGERQPRSPEAERSRYGR